MGSVPQRGLHLVAELVGELFDLLGLANVVHVECVFAGLVHLGLELSGKGKELCSVICELLLPDAVLFSELLLVILLVHRVAQSPNTVGMRVGIFGQSHDALGVSAWPRQSVVRLGSLSMGYG